MSVLTAPPAPAARADGGDGVEPRARPAGARARARQAAVPAAVAAIVLVTAVIALLTSGRGDEVPLDPGSYAPLGAHAIVGILDRHGVPVQVVSSSAALTRALSSGDRATVMVSRPDLLGDATTRSLESAVRSSDSDLVLVDPAPGQLDRLAPGIVEDRSTGRHVADPGCPEPDTLAAGRADAGGSTYVVTGGGIGCYPVDGSPSYVVSVVDGRRTVVIGQPLLLTNERIALEGNASLAIATLSHEPRLIWYVPDPLEGAGADAQQPLSRLLPSWVRWAALQAAVAVLVAMLWRGRRLGRLVTEPLPVVVRSVETTEGRARLYRRARSPERAARTLREAALHRLRDRLGLGRASPPDDVARLAAARSGRHPTEVAALLLGPAPADDPGLVRLAADLDRLDREVRRQ